MCEREASEPEQYKFDYLQEWAMRRTQVVMPKIVDPRGGRA